MCLGLSWVSSKKRNQFDKYLDVRGFDECLLHASGKAYWESDYPVHGLNFKLWNQMGTRGDTSCKNGIYASSSDKCFKYEVVKQLCMLVKFERDAVKNTFSWIYTGGCFENDKAVVYETAYPGESFDFKDI